MYTIFAHMQKTCTVVDLYMYTYAQMCVDIYTYKYLTFNNEGICTYMHAYVHRCKHACSRV